MIDNKQEIEPQKLVHTTNRRRPICALVILYVLGFVMIRKSNFDSTTGAGITALIFGWLFILLTLGLSVLLLFKMFKKQI